MCSSKATYAAKITDRQTCCWPSGEPAKAEAQTLISSTNTDISTLIAWIPRQRKTRQSSKSHLIWTFLLNNIMQTFQVFVLLPTCFRVSLWEPWQHSVGHPLETQQTLCLFSEPQTWKVCFFLFFLRPNETWRVVQTGGKEVNIQESPNGCIFMKCSYQRASSSSIWTEWFLDFIENIWGGLYNAYSLSYLVNMLISSFTQRSSCSSMNLESANVVIQVCRLLSTGS